MISRRALASAAPIVVYFSILACGGAPSARGAKHGLTAFDARYAELFDDGIDSAAVGLNLDSRPQMRGDEVLQERAREADGIIKVRVKTVTSKVEGADSAFLVDLHPFARIGGKKAPEADFSITITKRSPAFGIAKNLEGQLVGKTFIAFVRAFADKSDETVFHVHLAANSPDVEAAVKEAIALDELH